MNTATDDVFSPEQVMDPRALGALQPTRLSASRSLLSRMIRDGWQIERDVLELDARGNGHARYRILTPQGPLTFLAYLREPAGGNRTSRIIGTSWDMIGSLVDGVATAEQIKATGREIPKLYEGRAPEGTLAWFRSNQSLRIFRHVRESLAAGIQPSTVEVKRVGYLMRNTGLDGNGTFGTTSFPAIPQGHPLKTSYFAQMLAAYLMRELAVDVVEELARIDSPETATRLDPAVKQFIGVGNGSALGLVMFVYNRPVLINAYISAYVEAVRQVLSDESLGSSEDFDTVERLLDRTVRYRALDDTEYGVFASSKEIAADLRRIRAAVRAARRGEILRLPGESVFGAVHRRVRDTVTREATHSFNAILLEIIPEHCDRLVEDRLDFDESLDLDPQLSVRDVRRIIETTYAWALALPLNDESQRHRRWYQSRAAEEPRSGPSDEVPGAHELIPNYPVGLRRLLSALESAEDDSSVGRLLAERPELEHIARLTVALADKPYAVPHADPHDSDFVPVWLVRLMNSFIHGLDRTEDYLGRTIRGLIFEGAPFRDELADADPSGWWWSYHSALSAPSLTAITAVPRHKGDGGRSTSGMPLTPTESAITAPRSVLREPIVIKFREARLMAGRAYQALGLPEGSWHAAREFYLTALLGSSKAPDAFARLLTEAIDGETGVAVPWKPPAWTIMTDGTVAIDNQDQSLLATGHILINLLGGLPREEGNGFTICRAHADHAVDGLRLGLARYGIASTVEESSEGIWGTVAPAEDPEALRQRYQRTLDAFMHDGLAIPAQTFWDIHHRANAGLYPDTPISRQHTGATLKDVLQPGQELTRQFSEEELLVLADPDEVDNQNTENFSRIPTP